MPSSHRAVKQDAPPDPAAPPHHRRAPGRLRRWRLPVLLFIVTFVADVLSPSGMTADSMRAVTVAVALVHYHTIGLDHFRGLIARTHYFGLSPVGHHVYPLFPWGDSLFAVPWVVLYDGAHHLGWGEGSIAMVMSTHDWPLQVVSMSAVVAATTVVIYLMAVELLTVEGRPRRQRWALAVALTFAFATPAWSTASRSLWQHGPSMLCISLALLCSLRARSRDTGWVAMGFFLGASYLMRPTDSLVVAVVGCWVLVTRTSRAWRVVAGGAVPLACMAAVDLTAYHQLLTPYFTEGEGFAFSRTMGTALAGNIVSPSRGLILFCPLVAVSAAGVVRLVRARRMDGWWASLAALPVLHWVVISAFKHWWAGDSYGPRLFTDMMPILVVLALPAVDYLAGDPSPAGYAVAAPVRADRRRMWACWGCGLLLVWSVFVEAQGAVLRSAWCWNSEPLAVDARPSRLWDWGDPQWLRGARQVVFGPRVDEVGRDAVDLVGCPTLPLGG